MTNEKKTATIFKAFCDENRIRIIKLLQSGEKCAFLVLATVALLTYRNSGSYKDEEGFK